ncbi:hypothetical protein [Lysinibacillus xylanilyticus]|uniref:Uncharacterized protein n=1 Tax=Lysinibacillus xylanilyticus TaxID=582475 RepID=A0ABT4EXU4_9BACI|nr:hypothetical protein [Lysinibacillus xylanilyticus]MCY9549091.1 hypothetical protein [Lysinibacillus xylanilyticus]
MAIRSLQHYYSSLRKLKMLKDYIKIVGDLLKGLGCFLKDCCYSTNGAG